MENTTWSLGLSTSSKYGYSDYFVDEEENDDEYDVDVDYSCPFCKEDFDIVGLLCHIEEEHYDEAKHGVCPVCDTFIGADLVEHIALQHENVYKSGSRSRPDADSQSAIALIRKEMLERSFKSLLENSSSFTSSSNAAVDHLLASFVCAYSTPAEVKTEPSTFSAEPPVREETTEEDLLERSMKNCVISEEQAEQKTQRSKFVQSLLLSTFLDDGL